jgi:hypothetical protein
MRPVTGIGIDTFLVVVALILAILAVAGLFSPMLLLAVAVICLAIAALI